MKKVIALVMALVCLTAIAAMADSDLTRTPGSLANQTAVQIFAPDGNLTDTLSVASKTVDLSTYLMYAIYSTSGTCYKRLMATSAKGSYKQAIVPNGIWYVRAKNYNTPFINMSGCIGGYIQVQ